MRLTPYLLLLLPACGGANAVQDQIAVATYGAQQEQCVALAETRAQADVCRMGVKAHWCGPDGYLRDAGACSYDGGPIVTANGPPTDGGVK